MTELHLNFRNMTPETFSSFSEHIASLEEQQVKIPSFYDAVVSESKVLLEDSALQVSLAFRLAQGKSIPRDHVVTKLKSLPRKLGFRFETSAGARSNPIHSLTVQPVIDEVNGSHIFNNTVMSVEARTVIKEARIFLSNANAFEALSTMAVLHGVTKESKNIDVPMGNMHYVPAIPHTGYRTYMQHQPARDFIAQVSKNHADTATLTQRDDTMSVFIEAPKVLKSAGLGKKHLQQVIG